MKIPLALTIAGSDSGGGAGIQADLKTFAALGVHGMSAITAITAQNTVEVLDIQSIESKIINAQIEAIIQDIGVDAAKTGMLHSNEIINVVSSEIKKYKLLVVVDPVMISKSGAHLLRKDAVENLKNNLLPLAKIVTPNALEAEILSNINVESIKDAEKSAKIIHELGPEAVLIKGGHFKEKTDLAIDLLYWNDNYTILQGKYYDTKDTHGTGCSLSAAITAELAKKADIKSAVIRAKDYVNYAIKYSLRIGRGHGPLNHMAELQNNAEKFKVLSNIREAIKIIESQSSMTHLLAEVQMNIGMALPYSTETYDIAAVEGRITKKGDKIIASGCPWFGVSNHISKTILAIQRFDTNKRAAINLRYDEDILEICKKNGLRISWYDRREEPEEYKKKEGSTTFWGAEEAVKRIGMVPDVIYHLGDWGKEPMIVLIGNTAVEVAERAVQIAKKMKEKKNEIL
ncbi:bifunctional hydroxymethylpyrimidine kinase/phosphomethylpyrimidine kinase [Candidatus Bathyarchaeota archaeon]|nr:bifunctional hydroxymethylpyrimidine kinase/phosphomethylpyrimidine kinase [Candidatus Bathyarchaeota archaeon]